MTLPEPLTLLRLASFLAVLGALLLAERHWPRLAPGSQRGARWRANLGLIVIDSLALRLLTGGGAVAATVWAQARGLGALNQLALPDWLEGLLAVLALDLLIYLQHRLFHAVPLLWRLHRVHHSDAELDVGTALRFHPLEIVLSMLIKMAAVIALGAPLWAVVAFEVLLNATAMFNHANLQLAPALDRGLRWFVVTPDMHRSHHSVQRTQADANFGFNVPWWDRCLGTYQLHPQTDLARMAMGVGDLPVRRPGDSIWRLLKQPFD